MVRFLVAAALTTALANPVHAAPATSSPALFVVHDTDTTIYIFGTFHALDRKSQWFDATIRNAFEHSDELVLETIVPEDPADAIQVPQGHRPPSVTPSASFLATAQMAINAGQTRGMEVANGADMVLRHVAEAQGKQVEGLETLQLQLNMFNHMPTAPAPVRPGLAAAAASTNQIAGLSKALDEMQAAWKRGDQSLFVRMLDQLKSAAPETYRMMFTERNSRWADWIRARLRSPGTIFVAVGAGHLAGRDSLLVKLAERGIPSRRVY